MNVFLPPACVGCRTVLPPGEEGAPVCSACAMSLRVPPPPRCVRCDLPLGTGRDPEAACPECTGWPEELSAARCAVVLRPPADALVHGLKYEGWSTLAPFMGERMVHAVRATLPREDEAGPVVVPVPTTQRRLAARGYNQAELLARCVARRLGAALERGVERIVEGPTQVSLHPLERRANVDKAFCVRDGGRIVARDVLLIDDVLTTGATAGAVARVLVEAGVRRVTLLAFARALPDRS